VTGSAQGNVISTSLSAGTAGFTGSFDFNAANFFTCAVTGSTLFNVTNLAAGETANVLITVVQNGPLPPTASFSSNVKQISGSRYFPTSGSNGQLDILTFVAFDNSTVYLLSAKQFV
jgi:hypothetical protein